MPTVMIVDDNPSFRRQLCQLLTRAGLTVVGEAGDIPEAVELVEKFHPDIAVVDVMLPGISGIEGTPQLKALAPNLKVILVSAYIDQAEVFQTSAQQADAEAFISKDRLDMDVVRAWVENHKVENNHA